MSACALITTHKQVLPKIMEVKSIKSCINTGDFSKLESSINIQSFPVFHDSSSLFWTASLHNTVFFKNIH